MDLVEIFLLAYFYGQAEVIVPTRCEIENFRTKPYAGSAAAAGTCNTRCKYIRYTEVRRAINTY